MIDFNILNKYTYILEGGGEPNKHSISISSFLYFTHSRKKVTA